MLDSKLVVIPHRGPIYPKAGVYGPIETPYYEKTADILSLLNAGYPVTEVLEDQTQVVLNYHNYAKDNSGAASAHAEVDVPITPPATTVVPPSEPVVPPKQEVEPPLSKQERKRLKRLEEEQKNKAEDVDSDVKTAE